MSFIALIPARKGSTRLKNKNFKLVKGRPMIYYSVKASINCKFILETHIFSDSQKINDYAVNLGAINKVKRPKKISLSKTTMHETVNYFVKKLNLKKSKFKYLVLLQPTSPQRTYKDLNKACEKIQKNKKADALVSSYELKNMYSNKIMFFDGKYLSLNNSKKWKKNSRCYYRNGPSILITKIKNINKKNIYENGKIINFTMRRNKSIDINTPSDLKELIKNF
jgi:CMP-N,N'-diacetyllegionaminic acid synthase